VSENRLPILRQPFLMGVAGALGAVTAVWLGYSIPTLLLLGTILLTVSLVPLAAGFGAWGGGLLGVLFGVLWLAPRVGLAQALVWQELATASHIVPVLAMMAIGMLAGAVFGQPVREASSGATSPPPTGQATEALVAANPPPLQSEGELLRCALQQHHEWMNDWNRTQHPWTSFDTHVRGLLRQLTGARRIRCYRVDRSGDLSPLHSTGLPESNSLDSLSRLLQHVVTLGRRFVACSPATGEMIRALADDSTESYAWIVPIRGPDRVLGLITVEQFEGGLAAEDRLQLAADLIEQLWQHVHDTYELNLARLTDHATGVLNRVEFLSVIGETVERCYADHEPVVVLALGMEGIRALDDAGRWQARNQVIETVGHTIRTKLRHDDLVGRFSDDRFVALLRRLDIALAEMISRKLLEAAQQRLDDLAFEHALTIRGGLAASGPQKVPADSLLQQAFAMLAEARKQGQSLLAEGPKSLAEVGT